MGIHRATTCIIGLLLIAAAPVTALDQRATCSEENEPGPWSALKEHFLLRQPPSSVEDDSRWSFLGNLQPRPSFEFLIATVPDPQRTNLSLYLDRNLESLMWAADDAGYTFERYWLPWTAKSEPELSSLADRRCREQELKHRYSEPGLLIFRKTVAETGPSVLLMFIVGETPTGGVNKLQFIKALHYMESIQPREVVRIVGPVFSGSLHPLAGDLKALLQQSPALQIRLISGQATNLSAISDFHSALESFGNRVRYESAIENDDRASKLFISFIEQRWAHPREIALLSEDDTVYGTLATSLVSSTQKENSDWLSIRYPREISRLRNASQQDQSDSGAKSADSVVEGVRSTLKETAADENAANAKDSIGFYSKVQSAASQQASLLAIGSSIKREGVDLAGVIATDVLDALFLSRFLRLAVPDTRLFTFDSDLLFIKESQVVSFTGMLSITTYPLISRNQHWTQAQLARGVPRRVAFASRYAEGVYNACRALLQSGKAWDEQKKGEFLLEFAPPLEPGGNQPPLWLTIAGRDAYWPLALLDDPAIHHPQGSLLKSEHTTAITEQLHPESPGLGWTLLVSVLTALSLAHCAYVTLLFLITKNEAEDKPEGARRFLLAVKTKLGLLFRVYPKTKITAYEAPFLFAGTSTLFCSLFLTSQTTHRFHESTSRPQEILQFIGIAALLFLFVIALLLGFRVFRKARHTEPSSRKIAMLICSASSLLAIYFCLTLRNLINDDRFQTGTFFAYRGFTFSSGVSPLLPLMLLACAYFYWTWMHLRREQLTGPRRRFEQPKERLGKIERPALCVLPDEKWSDHIVSAEIQVPAIIVAICWLVALRPWQTVRSLESRSYDLLYWVQLLLLFYMTTVCWTHLIWGWRHFRKFLQALERNPVRHAFSRLRRQSSWVPLVAQLPEHQLLITSMSCDTLQAIEKFDLKDCDITERNPWETKKLAFAGAARRAHKLRVACENQARNGSVNPVHYTKLQLYLETIASTFVRQLSESEWQRGDSDSRRYELERSDKKNGLSPQEQLLILVEEFIAFRYLIFMRYVFRHMRNLIGFVIAGFVLSLFSLESYPFQGQRWISFTAIASFLFLGTGIAFIFAEMDRDAILSRLTETKPNELSRHFLFKMLQYGSIPLLTVLSSQFPWIDKIIAWAIKPALDALH